jgi:deoxycytidylate deaminase
MDNPEWEVSAILDALYGSRENNLEGTSLFSTIFPSLEDMKMILSVGISSVYFFGNVTDVTSVELVNASADNSIPLELIQLQ